MHGPRFLRVDACQEPLMQTTQHLDPEINVPAAAPQSGLTASAEADKWPSFPILRRHGADVCFEPSKTSVALTKDFLALHGSQTPGSAHVRDLVQPTPAVLRVGKE